jgi:transcriptional/translational regulatory protein YebC/TACO1
MFERKGVVNVEKENLKEDDLMEIILDAGADDLKTEGDYYEVIAPVENFEKVRKAIEDKSYIIESASLQYIAKDLIQTDGKNSEEVIRFIEAIEENDDVQNVYTNADFTDE